MSNIYIKKSGFYKSSDISGKKIIIEDNIHVSLFDDSDNIEKIKVLENSTLEYFSFFGEPGDYSKHIILKGTGSKCVINSLNYNSKTPLSSKGEGLGVRTKIIGETKASNSEIKMNILSFAGENGNINIDGILKINKNLKGVKGRLDEENIFLGDNSSISGIPTLLIESFDVEASHACKMEKISDEKLFYLRSRGIGKENALNMIIEAKINSLFKCLSMYSPEFHRELLEKVLKTIK